MSRNPYGTYRGRKSLLQRILTAVAVILVVALLLALVALFVLPNYMTYTGEGLQFNLPLPGRGQGAHPSGGDEPGFVIDDSPADVTPSAPVAEKVKLSSFARRELPRGLVTAAGEGARAGQGSIFDQRVPPTNPDPSQSVYLLRGDTIPYAAVYVDPDWDSILTEDAAARSTGFTSYITDWCLSAAARGYDEIILAESVTPADDPTGQAQAALYRQLKTRLDQEGWQGRLSLVLDQNWTGRGYDADLMPAVAQSFERLYFRRSMQSATRTALTNGGFDCSAYQNIVTVYATVPNVTYYWAVLPR